jgi:hypothetical protein
VNELGPGAFFLAIDRSILATREARICTDHSIIIGLGVALRDLEIPLSSKKNCGEIERSIDRAIGDTGMRITLRTSLRKFPGCVHWHVKDGRKAGTLEITFWPEQRRAWFSIQSGRRADWIEEKLNLILAAIQREM